MSEIKVPTCGRIVHYFPNGVDTDIASICAANHADKVPAIVVQTWGGLHINISIFPMNPYVTNVLGYSVPHKSQIESCNAKQAYWDWPEVK